MTYLKRIVATILVAIGLTISAAPLAYADAASECATAGYNSGANATACQNAYGKDAAFCANANQQVRDACNKGVELGKAANTSGSPTGGSTSTGPGECGGTKTGIVTCSEDAGIAAIGAIIKIAITVLTVLIGIVAVGGIGYAAILYASARDNQTQVQNAIGIIRNVVIGIVLYGFTIAIVNWLIPGGVIG